MEGRMMKEVNPIKVSVIIPIYNEQEYLPQCLDSICGQTLQDIEILCVNDESTDKSEEIIREYMESDARVILVQNSHIGGGGQDPRGTRVLHWQEGIKMPSAKGCVLC